MASVSLRRYGQIADVLVKYGFGYFINEMFPGFINTKKAAVEEFSGYSAYVRIRMALEELGPTFVKFGQLMSTRTELFPAEMIDELCKLQDRVGVVPFDEVIPTLDEYIPDWRDVFTSVDPKPLAAASISQVYRAVMQDGTILALKIQRPRITARIEQDVVLLRSIAQLLEDKRPELRIYNPVSLVDDFTTQIRKELDFTRDGMNAERLARNMKFSGIPGIKVPKIYWDISGKELLAMEFVAGCRSDDIDAILAMGMDPKDLASRGLKAFMIQIFQNGFYHGDPHAGNLRISPSGDLVFLDFGVCGVVMKDMRNKFISLILALLSADTDLTIRYIKNLGVQIPSTGIDEFRSELYLALLDYKEMGAQVNFSGLLGSIQDLFQKNNIRVPANIMQLLKALMLVSNVAFTLDPDLEFTKEVEPFLKKIVADDMRDPANIQKKLLDAKVRLEDLARVPRQLGSVLEMASEGKLKVDISAKEVTDLSKTIESSVDKLVIGLILSAIVIGLSLVMMSQTFTSEFLPVIAYIAAVLVIIVIFYKMRSRSKKHED
ncbi:MULTISPECIES: ABC1 kinase family protein [Methanocorpusculum]|jgi:ubiquinone biosynthesis protein|uniref:ABC1 kinase family protein n=1 Tax=Methanocorpusculum TaxID=2192 RepID=UPI0005B2E9B4|nr:MULTISPECIES: AarF/UbiB family protein [Methanocorpusculum]NLC91152.1 AarF/ABC1/UbiB kinase family protein [Methanocorpusculum parvum]MDD2249220.1 AarF/UbiB family protein [Methanocorpusculum sp.]MDD2803819.1 AarF/UbiB family protein [Methanocorpusculum sp.]MDD3047560.1 AarF/UbiB family protein [Methanocorpusculum sp.]MDY3203080.1 AarF/UbiB family protein [Methanocorpusculum sp.]